MLQRKFALLVLFIGLVADVMYINTSLLSLVYKELRQQTSYYTLLNIELGVGVLMTAVYVILNKTVDPSRLHDALLSPPRVVAANDYTYLHDDRGTTTAALIV